MISDQRTKICSKCRIEKPRSEFYARTNRASGLQSRCKQCANQERWKHGRFRDEAHRQRVLAANRASYQRNHHKYVERQGRRNAANKIKALEAHGAMACMRCGFDTHPAALEFHHRDPSQKRFNVANAIQAPDKYPWDVILHELQKCDVVCSNCHKIEHSRRSYGDLWEVRQANEQRESFLGESRLDV